MKIVKLIVASVLICLSMSTLAQPSTDEMAGKRAIYVETLEKIKELEEKAQYSGDDPIIRERLNLPPKLPEFDEWIAQVESKKEQLEIQNQQAQPTPSVESQAVNAQVVKQPVTTVSFKWTDKETTFILASFFTLLFINFLIYCFVKSGRSFFVSTPFDLGTRGQKNDLEKTVKWKKYFIELFLLLILLLAIPFSIEDGKTNSEENIVLAMLFGLKLYAACHFGYVIIRGIWGASSRCSKCGTSFAARMTSSWEEPKATYEKVGHLTSGRKEIFETGVRHQQFGCIACGAEWSKMSSYKKSLNPHG